MIFDNYRTRLFLLTLTMFITSGLCAYCFVNHYVMLGVALLIILAILFYYSYSLQIKTTDELKKFTEAIRYRDFTSRYNEQQGSAEIKVLHKNFNEINSIIRALSKEKEAQYHYLQNIMELVDTGILCYNIATGDVIWLNNTLKQILHIPYLKSISSLSKRYELLAEKIQSIQPGNQEVTSIEINFTSCKIMLSASVFTTGDDTFKLIAFQNTDKVLVENESDAWQKLLRVITHEIMNSIAPIASLADTLENMLDKASTLDEEMIADMKTSVQTIKGRSEGLLKFTKTYHNLYKINTIEQKPVTVSRLFETINHLMLPGMEQRGITFEIVLSDSDMTIKADQSLIEQVLINLTLNAMDAVAQHENPSISLSAGYADDGKVNISIKDCGCGIDNENIDKIFVPFFTTKKTGNGIGLNICRRIMTLHNGSIYVQSVKDVGTKFVLSF